MLLSKAHFVPGKKSLRETKKEIAAADPPPRIAATQKVVLIREVS
jgi:hypothetical protein